MTYSHPPFTAPTPGQPAIHVSQDGPLEVRESTAMMWLRAITYSVVIATCVIVGYTVIRLWLALQAFAEGWQHATQGLGG